MTVDGVKRAMTRQVRCAWEVYAAKELGMSAGESLRAFDNWVESLSETPVRPYGAVTPTPEEVDAAAQSLSSLSDEEWAAARDQEHVRYYFMSARLALEAAHATREARS